MAEHQYGRGKFDAHANYVEYMQMIVAHANYQGMPNATSADGKIKWQVSSGKTTSFYKDYLARRDWWIAKADEFGLPGKDDENDRFTTVARLNHPTGYRACRLCGQSFNVGYFYLNHRLTVRLNKDFPILNAEKNEPIDVVIDRLLETNSQEDLKVYFAAIFKERLEHFEKYGVTKEAFERSNHVRSYMLSPGFMGNPPDRLDGFHDYDVVCRKKNDPGRFDENMRTYNHDRRSFEWWAEGNWAIADALYNTAGPGTCVIDGCGKKLKKVSPDHVGPLACGFRQLPFFLPTCPTHNSAKNRRFSFSDVRHLRSYERTSGESVASWQVKAHWDKYKAVVKDDKHTKALSNSMRSLQDMYLRTLWEVYRLGKARFLSSLLSPEYAFQDFEFLNLDSSNFTYTGIRHSKTNSKLRRSLAVRTIRIAFEALEAYASKPIEKRKMVRSDFSDNKALIDTALEKLAAISEDEDTSWRGALRKDKESSDKESALADLIKSGRPPAYDSDNHARKILTDLFDEIGQNADVDFSRYDLDYEEI